VISQFRFHDDEAIVTQFRDASKWEQPSRIKIGSATDSFTERRHIWITGSILVRNEGQAPIVIRPDFDYEKVGHNSTQEISSGAIFIPIGEQCILQWYRTYNTLVWHKAAAVNSERDRLGGHQKLPIKAESSIVPGLIDSYIIEFDWYPLTRIDHREESSTYQVDYTFPPLRVVRKPRKFPDEELSNVMKLKRSRYNPGIYS
jgi:hypothetical protein